MTDYKVKLEDVITVSEAAAIAGVSEARIKDAAKRGTIISRTTEGKTKRRGGIILLYRAEIVAKWVK